jgi:hypothetical protein
MEVREDVPLSGPAAPPDADATSEAHHRSHENVSRTAKMLGVAVPVLVATTFCLTVPFILIVADAAILAAAVLTFASERLRASHARDGALPELE